MYKGNGAAVMRVSLLLQSDEINAARPALPLGQAGLATMR